MLMGLLHALFNAALKLEDSQIPQNSTEWLGVSP
jgi:hypothetical protein